jgi:hypothetical protein
MLAGERSSSIHNATRRGRYKCIVPIYVHCDGGTTLLCVLLYRSRGLSLGIDLTDRATCGFLYTDTDQR